MIKYTASPWKWFGTKGGIYLVTPDRGRLIVMDFVRHGMQGAQPRFGVRTDDMGGVMCTAQRLAAFKGYPPYEMLDLPHPDARLIENAAEMYRALRLLLELAVADSVRIDGEWGPGRNIEEIEADGDLQMSIKEARTVIAKIERGL